MMWRGEAGHEVRNPYTWKTLTRRLSLLNAFVRTEIIWHNAASCSLMIAHRHAFSTPATENEALQERRALAWRGETLGSIGLTIHCQLALISLVVLPTKI